MAKATESETLSATMKKNPLAEDLDYVLQNTQKIWTEFKNQKIFITGGTGFFGKWFLESFLWANQKIPLNAQITVLSRNPEKFKNEFPHLGLNKAVEFITGDVESFEFPQGEFKYFIHNSTADNQAHFKGESQKSKLDLSTKGTRRVLEFATKANCKKLLLTSSGSAESKNSPVGQCKVEAENLCLDFAKKSSTEIKIARCFAFIGPYLPLELHFAAGNFIRDALKEAPIVIQGDGTPLRSYMYMSDLMIWLWTILEKGQSQKIYNVGSEIEVSIKDLATKIANQVSKNIEVKVKKTTTGAQPERYIPRTRETREELDLKETVPLEVAIQKTFNFYKVKN